MLGLGSCNLGKTSSSTPNVTPDDVFTNNVNIKAPKGDPKGLYPARTVQRCRQINQKTGLVTVRIGLPTERFAAAQRDAAEEKQAKHDLLYGKGPVGHLFNREKSDEKYLLVEYTREMCGFSKKLKINYKHSGFASMSTN